MKLYSYFRSSASYRVRIALHWKELQFEYLPVQIRSGEQDSPTYRWVNPMGHVPALDHDGFLIAESMAIIEYVDSVFTAKPLFPIAPRDRATVVQICELINSGIQPLQNLKVQKLLEGRFKMSKPDSDAFVHHWIEDGLRNLEKLLERTAGEFCFGDTVTAAECFLVPQCLTARRFAVEVDQFPLISRVNARAIKLEAFTKAQPEQQPDFSPALRQQV